MMGRKRTLRLDRDRLGRCAADDVGWRRPLSCIEIGGEAQHRCTSTDQARPASRALGDRLARRRLAEFTWRGSVGCAEHPAEVSLIGETPAIADGGDALVGIFRVDQVAATAFEPAFAYIG